MCGARAYRVRKLGADGEFATITQALAQWNADKQGPDRPRVALIEIGDNATYDEAPHIVMGPDERLELRAANMAHPVLRMFNCHSGAPEQIRISGAPGCAFTLDGVVVDGGAIEIDDGSAAPPCERFLVTLRHCSLVPGGDANATGPSSWRGKASVVLHARRARVRIEHSIAGPVRVVHHGGLLALQVNDSIIDASHAAGLAISDDAYGSAFARVSILRSTIIGVVQVEELSVAEDTVFLGPLLAVRRNTGRVRSCYIAQGSRMPAGAAGQPDAARQWEHAGIERESRRERPRYLSLRYGTPGYCQLAPHVDAKNDGDCDNDAVVMRPPRYVPAPCLATASN